MSQHKSHQNKKRECSFSRWLDSLSLFLSFCPLSNKHMISRWWVATRTRPEGRTMNKYVYDAGIFFFFFCLNLNRESKPARPTDRPPTTGVHECRSKYIKLREENARAQFYFYCCASDKPRRVFPPNLSARSAPRFFYSSFSPLVSLFFPFFFCVSDATLLFISLAYIFHSFFFHHFLLSSPEERKKKSQRVRGTWRGTWAGPSCGGERFAYQRKKANKACAGWWRWENFAVWGRGGGGEKKVGHSVAASHAAQHTAVWRTSAGFFFLRVPKRKESIAFAFRVHGAGRMS